MKEEDEIRIRRRNARRLIFEMIRASIDLSVKKGPHPLENGCTCIACVNKRKTLLRGSERKWTCFP